jgi:hypothetical protein
MRECNRDLLFLFFISGACSVKEFATAGEARGCRRVCQFNATINGTDVSDWGDYMYYIYLGGFIVSLWWFKMI